MQFKNTIQPQRGVSDLSGEYLAALFPEGDFKYLTTAFHALTLETVKEWLNQPLSAFLDDARNEATPNIFEPLRNGSTVTLARTCCRLKGGSSLSLDLSLVPVHVHGRLCEILLFGKKHGGAQDSGQAHPVEADEPLRLATLGKLKGLRAKDLNYALAQFFEQLLAQAPVGFCFFNRALRYTCINECLAKMNGYAPGQHLGRTPGELLPQVAHVIEPAVKNVLETGKAVTDVETSQGEGGDTIHTVQNFYPVVADGEVIGVGCLAIDNSARKIVENRLLRSETRLRLAVEGGELGTWDWSPASGEIDWCSRAKAFAGLPADAPVDYEIFLSSIHPDDRARVEVSIQRALEPDSDGVYRAEYRTIGITDFKDRWLSVRGQVLFDEKRKPIRFIGIGLEISERKKLEVALERAARELVRSNKDLEEFAYIASHDLQEPLRMVSSYIRLLKKRIEGSLDEESHLFMNFAADGAARMKELIDDLLRYSRLSIAERKFVAVPLEKCVRESLQNLKLAIEETGAAIEIDALPEVSCDPVQMAQLFQNLIGNAIKYRRDDEAPRIRIHARVADHECTLAVTDNGIGIEPTYKNCVFDLFRRLHNREKYSGTGVGLASCKRIVERHQGRIWLESTPGAGSTFYFTIPSRRPTEAGG